MTAMTDVDLILSDTLSDNNSGYEAVGARLIVLPDVVPETYEGSVLLRVEAERNKESAATIMGTVVQVGAECWMDHPVKDWCKVGDRILYGKYRGYEIKGNDEKTYRIIGDLDVVALIKPKAGE